MSIGGGDGPIGPIDGAGMATAVADVNPVDGVDAAHEVTAASGVAEVAASAPARSTDAIDQIAADFSSGKIDRDRAIEAIVETVMPPHVQGVGRGEMKTMMLELAASDIYLQQLIARLDAKR